MSRVKNLQFAEWLVVGLVVAQGAMMAVRNYHARGAVMGLVVVVHLRKNSCLKS